MAWFWSDDLARLLIERDGVSPDRVQHWISGPTAHRTEVGALELARQLLGEEPVAGRRDASTTAA